MLRADGSTGPPVRTHIPRWRGDRQVKYETPYQQRNGLDIPPGMEDLIGDPSVPLWVTEGVKKALQNLELGGSSMPHGPTEQPVAVSPPPPSPLGSTSVSFHRCSVMSVIRPRHLRHDVLRPWYVVCFKTGMI